MSKNEITAKELEEISAFARREMKSEEIYTFPLILCDNEIDRDNEKFTVEALGRLAELFKGRTGIFDHDMSSRDQTARIYETEVVTEPGRKTADGEEYTCLRARAYMVRTEKNKDLIAEIEAGIKKETSVGCSMGRIECSVCGRDVKREDCGHIKGRTYGGRPCFYKLCDPADAYEWSFVAVPAQKGAGIVKSYTPAEISGIEKEYREDMTASAIRYGARILPDFVPSELVKICDALPLGELRIFRDSLAREAKKHLPLVSQLMPDTRETDEDNNEKYII